MPTNNGLNASALRDSLQQLATREGIRSWDLGAACSDDCSVQVDRGEAKQLKASQRSSITVRVWNSDGLVGITSTTDLSDKGLEQALVGAHEASRFIKSPSIDTNCSIQRFSGIIVPEPLSQ
jgi:PmbA protein